MDPAGILTPRNRIISESTGLVKLQLSPQRNLPHSSPTRTKGLKVQLPIVEQKATTKERSRSDLLAKYASKQAKLMELEKQTEALRFELLELEAELQLEINREFPLQSIKARANVEVSNLKKKVSTIFQQNVKSDQVESLRSPMKTPMKTPMKSSMSTSGKSPMKAPMESSVKPPVFASSQSPVKKPSMLFNNQEIRKKASTVFNNKFLAEVRGKLDQQQAEIEDFAKKSSDMAKNFWGSLLPKKETQPNIDSSFVFENVKESEREAETSFLNKSILLSDDSAIDIDDYTSEEES